MKNSNDTLIKYTITVGIPAHNEERNIGTLIDSLMSQVGSNFILDKIIVACDGCTDGTANIVRTYMKKEKRLHLIDDGQRVGKGGRLNWFYKNLNSDIFISFDGDVVLGDAYVVSKLVAAFKDKRVVLAGGHTIPHKQSSIVGRALEAYEYFWRCVIESVENGNNVHGHLGPISAARQSFVKSIVIPQSVFADDHFLYHTAMKKKGRFAFVKDAYVYMHVPSTLRDFLKQSTRFSDSATEVCEHFDENVSLEYVISISVKLKAYIRALMKYPLYLPLALVLMLMQRVYSFFHPAHRTGAIWSPVVSSK